MNLIFNGKTFIVCVKPAGMESEEGKNHNGFTAVLRAELGCDIYPIHRLDKNVGGVMVYAKTKKAAANLCEQFNPSSGKTAVKEYIAAVHNHLEKQHDTLFDFIFKDTTKGKAYIAKKERKGVKKASLDYTVKKNIVIDQTEGDLVSVQLHTGRFHQIRVQFASRKHPIFGDGKYGAKDNLKSPLLFCTKLKFISPDTNEEVSFESSPDWLNLL